jgi:hypothetical protein
MDMKKNHGLGGLIVMEDQPNGMKAGTMLWSGMPNTYWVCSEICILFGY